MAPANSALPRRCPRAYPISVAVGDFNGDGKQDLVAANYGAPGTVSVLLGDGAGISALPQISLLTIILVL